jgi:hypothetical protein
MPRRRAWAIDDARTWRRVNDFPAALGAALAAPTRSGRDLTPSTGLNSRSPERRKAWTWRALERLNIAC